MMNYDYRPDEIANTLYELARDMDWDSEYEEDTKNELTEALTWLLGTCQNELNSEYFRTLYRTLDTIAYNHRLAEV
jgi:hypothetical protein